LAPDERLVLMRGDITTLEVDAIVNAANSSLMVGGGVCGAIHRAAGPDLAEACAEVAPCPTGESRMTPGFALKAHHVIHTVGPVWRGGACGEERLLASCYRSAMALAEKEELASIAFPAISTGIYGYPRELAAPVAVRELAAALLSATHVRRVVCICFDADTHAAYESALQALAR
jgi:O-acetyl-ADP-ribose deacetylase (regulator of RNase III)